MKKSFLLSLPLLFSAVLPVSAATHVTDAQVPEVVSLQKLDTLTVDGKELHRDQDYTADVQLSNDKQDAYVLFTFKGDLEGQVVKHHVIGDVEPFADSIDHYAQSGIGYVSDLGFMRGKADGLFHPNDAVVRGDLVTILQRMAHSDEKPLNNPFGDVDPNNPAYFTFPALWAYQNGIVKGYTDDQGVVYFRGDKPISRQEMAVMLYRFKGAEQLNGDLESAGFADAQDVGDPYREAMLWATQKGIINGSSDEQGNTFLNPKNDCTRAQMALMLERFYKLG